jgi:hypothetical protein
MGLEILGTKPEGTGGLTSYRRCFVHIGTQFYYVYIILPALLQLGHFATFWNRMCLLHVQIASVQPEIHYTL